MGRHKIPIKMIEKQDGRDICFSKRKKGLFSKAKQLARAGGEVAIIVFSRAGNIFTFSHPSIESVAGRFLSQQNIKERSSKDDNFHGDADFVYLGFDAARGGPADFVCLGFDAARGGPTGPSGEGETSNKGDELDGGNTIMQDKGFESDHEEDELESETSSKTEGSDIAGSSQEEHALMHDGEHATAEQETSTDETLHGGRFWWNKRIENLELHELVEFESALVELRGKVRDQANQILVEKPVMGYYFDFGNYNFKFPEPESQDQLRKEIPGE
ncbi:putative agamous-like MADS-box protein AGL61 [Cocos nucifera]|nr:putative agamous-like MADS-box protein AGL61 [Cocos nucifera]